MRPPVYQAFDCLLLCLCLTLFPGKSAAQAEPPLRLGALLCLTADCAEWGTEALHGMQLAAAELNERGGILSRELLLVVENSDETQPSKAVNAYRRLRDVMGINFIVGPSWTPAGLAIAPIAAKDPKVILISPSLGVKDFNQAGANLFNLWPHDENGTRMLAKFTVSKGWHRVAIFSSQQPWVKTQSDIFQHELSKQGGSTAARVDPLEESRDFRAEAFRLIRSAPDAILIAMASDPAALAAKELRKLNFTGPKLTVLIDQTTIRAADGAMEGIYFVRYPPAEPDFMEKYRQKFGYHPGISADTGYDAVHIYAAAIENVGSLDPELVAPILAKLRGYPGASGDITFDEQGGVIKQPLLFQLVKGQQVRAAGTEPF